LTAIGLDSAGFAAMVRQLFEPHFRSRTAMAKQATILVKLVSTADTGYYYVTKKNPRSTTEKLEFRKYDPVAKKHVAFKEHKIK
jgi:large subunit ribosomal protein L33